MESCYSQKYWLRLNNIIQYYSQPSSIKSDKPQFKFIILENRKLTNGKTGKKMIQIAEELGENPQEQLRMVAEREEGKEFNILESKVEPVIITRDWLMNHEMDFEIIITPNSSVRDSEVTKTNKDIAFYQMTSQDPMFDQVMNRKDLASAFGKPEDIVKEQQAETGMDINQLGSQPAVNGNEINTPLI
jgi:hypothetical protein